MAAILAAAVPAPSSRRMPRRWRAVPVGRAPGRVAAGGGRRDPACREVLEGLDARRAANMLELAADLRSTGELRPELTDEQVAHLLWTTNSAAFYRLATSGGRGPADYAAHGARPLDPHAPRARRRPGFRLGVFSRRWYP